MSRGIFVSTACVAQDFRSLEHQLDAYQAAGINDVELGHCPPPNSSELSAEIRRRGLRVLLHNYFPPPAKPFVLNLASADSNVLAKSRAMMFRALEISAEVGAPFYSVHSGFRAEIAADSLGAKLRFGAVQPEAEAWRRFDESIRAGLAFARSRNVRLLLEPNVVAPFNYTPDCEQVLMMATANEIVEFFGRIADPNVGLLLDSGHLNVTARTLGYDREEFVERVAPWIGAFHFHDNDGLADQHQPAGLDSWAAHLVRDSRFTDLPVIVEAKFTAVDRLAAYARSLTSQLTKRI